MCTSTKHHANASFGIQMNSRAQNSKFRGGTSSGALLKFKSWMQDIECAIKDRNLNNDKVLQLIKEFSKGARDNINFYLEVTDKPSMDGLFENLRQVCSSGEDGQQMLAEFYSRIQNPKELVKEFRESLLQIARKIMMAKWSSRLISTTH